MGNAGKARDFKLAHTAPAQDWIDAGFAVRSHKAVGANLREIAFREAQAKALAYLTGAGALAMDREAMKHTARP